MRHVLATRRRLGMSLGSALLVVTILATLAFTMASASVGHLQISTHRGNAIQAEHLASSAVSLALEKVLKDPTYGTDANLGDVLEVRQESQPDGLGLVTFNPANNRGIPYSTNNLEATSSKLGWNNEAVPATGLRLIGVGQYRGVTRTVEAVLHVPAFPYCLAAAGPVEARGGLVVAGVPKGTDPVDVLTSATSPVPVEMISNSADSRAVVLPSGANITGNVLAAGNIVLEDTSSIRLQGELHPGADPAKLPEIDLNTYDPQKLGRPYTTVTVLSPSPTLVGIHRFEGTSLTVAGDLTLDGGLLFVKGDLRITGALKGKGGVVVTGTTRIEGGAAFNSDSRVALYTGGKLTLQGQDKASNCFKGWVYTAAGLEASQISILGTLVSRGSVTDKVVLDRCNLVFDPTLSQVSVGIGELPDVGQSINVSPPQVPGPTSTFSKILFDPLMIVFAIPVTGQAHVVTPNPDPQLTIMQVQDLFYGTHTGTIDEISAQLTSMLFFDGYLDYLQGAWDTAQAADPSNLLRVLLGMSLPPAPTASWAALPGLFKSNLASSLEAIRADAQASSGAPTASVLLMDPSQFLKLEDRIQVRLWRLR